MGLEGREPPGIACDETKYGPHSGKSGFHLSGADITSETCFRLRGKQGEEILPPADLSGCRIPQHRPVPARFDGFTRFIDPPGHRPVSGTVQERRLCRFSVATGPAGLLKIRLNRRRHVPVNDGADIPEVKGPLMAFQGGYRAKTTPGSLQSRSGGASGPMVITRYHKAFSIRARNFTKQIHEKISKKAPGELKRAIGRWVRKLT